jgi:hypothetical protein
MRQKYLNLTIIFYTKIVSILLLEISNLQIESVIPNFL